MADAPLDDLHAFAAVARARGFRGAAVAEGVSASALSEAVRRLETRLGVRLLNRTTRSVAPTEAGLRLLERLTPALDEIAAALDGINSVRARPSGTLRLNVPVIVARFVLPPIVSGFLGAYPDIMMDVMAEDGFVDILAAGFDAGVRYDERLELDMIAVPIGPRTQRYVAAASPAYLAARGRPNHPGDLVGHACVRHRFPGRASPAWEFERDDEVVRVSVQGPLVASTLDLQIGAAVAGLGILYSFEDALAPEIGAGRLVPVLEDWWQSFSGPYLYYAGRRYLPAPLRAFVDYVRGLPAAAPG